MFELHNTFGHAPYYDHLDAHNYAPHCKDNAMLTKSGEKATVLQS